ncbi:Gfo/Idh/MocA family oxidoreductase [Haloferax mediterranei ATCC 33500]|uniref:Dehydrogenase n=1 Tax=Haloferax mediterranei (strain ATCC 33500 / DSM 1411 / JCM 8866 / NBRC 14739 / NCIMB 2177 / R-4) TaxID=523841 RepID=I3R3B2_HALMT|nr:Gfo/Idh/MocA family oxidoreductase [Haloferax mediterranei]AFK18722.1 oxidoreductase [Haloferax mediterranei ATCC 33500]AHZ21910.1 dehydrogenase [Haloferax mediterranei ATCC 33500]EMA03418.1 oxidoreductase [Haloferax mediterranei ATCC 33500]MDX5988818.1 Gfo/Idh/MocA family oxidoreductase [Haloferax mediterranei ATCC 33500]QCQ75221.1 Gfo/Idh/MocA family oxidoreductase [Haloferax mediterranei ATCC 33500]
MFRVAGIGLGTLGTIECRLLDELDGVSVVAGVDPDDDARERFEDGFDATTYESVEALLDGEFLDAVAIASPHAEHFNQALAALETGLHVHVEKPMVTDLGGARALIDRAEEEGLILAVGYQRHLDPRFHELRRIIDSGRIGDPHMVVCHLEQEWIEWTKDEWRGDPARSGGGQLYDSGSHLLDAMLWVTRSKPVTVAAAVDHRGYDVDVNSALAVVLDRDGERLTASVAVSGDGSSVPDPGEWFRVIGTEGMVTFDGKTIEVAEGDMTYRANPPVPEFEALARKKLRNFVDAARDEGDLLTPPEDALQVTALTEAAYESATTGRRVNVNGDA